jgi:uncharacterized protein YlaI
MTDDTRQLLATVCGMVGLAWWLGVEVWRGVSRKDSARVFWIHLTAPIIAIILMAAALWLLISAERVRRSHAPHQFRPESAMVLICPNCKSKVITVTGYDLPTVVCGNCGQEIAIPKESRASTNEPTQPKSWWRRLFG